MDAQAWIDARPSINAIVNTTSTVILTSRAIGRAGNATGGNVNEMPEADFATNGDVIPADQWDTWTATGGTGNYETYYRAMSQADYEIFVKTGKIPATGETFISHSQAYSSGYNGVLVEFKVNSGTSNLLEAIGVRDTSLRLNTDYPNMPSVQSGWGNTNAYFKYENGQVNIGLGRGSALDIFNNNIVDYSVISH